MKALKAKIYIFFLLKLVMLSLFSCNQTSITPALPEICDLYDYNETTFFGKGTKEDPFWICIPEQMPSVGKNDLDKYYALVRDIDMSGRSFAPIKGEFTGTFDGKDKKVIGLRISSNSRNIGFFGTLRGSAVIENLTFQSPVIDLMNGEDGQNAGVLAGIIEQGNVIIRNVHLINGTVRNGGGGDDSMGGLIGYQSGGSISNSMISVNISNSGGEIDSMGGLVGHQEAGQIINSIAISNISDGGDEGDNMGGLVGLQSGIIQKSLAVGNISDGGTGGDFMGGLVGFQNNSQESSPIQDSISGVNVSGGGMGDDNMGGLIGEPADLITRVISLGEVNNGGGESGDSLGGFIGVCISSTITNSYWAQDTSGQDSAISDNSTIIMGCEEPMGKNTNELQMAVSNTLAGITTENGWHFGTNSQYPGLSFTDNQQTCMVRPYRVNGTSTPPQFLICPDAIDKNSFHPACRTKPTGCP